MKKTLLILYISALSSITCFGQTTIAENFESGLPSTAPNTETPVVLESGTWTINGCYGKTDNGSLRLSMNTAGYAITSPVNKPVSLSFYHRGSGSGKTLTVYKSVNNGISWISIGTATVSSSSTYTQSNMSVGEAGAKDVLLKFVCASATIYIDNVTISCSDLGDAPTIQAALSVTEITGTSMKIHFTKGNGTGRLLVFSKEAAVNWIPEAGTTYQNLPKDLADNVTAVYSGNADEVTVTGLIPGTVYHYAVYEYSGAGTTTNYLTTTVGRLEQKTAEVPGITVSPAALNFGTVKIGTLSKRSFTVSGKYLQSSAGNGKISIQSSADFPISFRSATGFSSSLELPVIDNSLADTVIYVLFQPAELKQYSSTLAITGGGAQNSLLLTGTGSNTTARVYYLSPAGNDSGEGTYDSPWYNLQKAVDMAVPGDTIQLRGGTYYPTMMKDGSKTTIRLTTRATSDKRITIKNYQDEFPVLNFKDQPKKLSIRGILLDGDYWHIKGLHITQAGDNGIKLEGNHNIVERCTFSYNDDTGLQLGFGHSFSDSHPGISSNDGSYCCYNDIVDCDSYLNCDADNFGSDADGFACKMHNGLMNRFIRCRAWDNADDGWDLYETDYPVYLIECWAWGSGRASNFGWVQASGSFQGNGNGIKMGGNGTGGSSRGKHEAWNCIAFNCNKTGSVKGFDQNSHSGGEKLVNCLAFGNGYDFMFEVASANREYYNNVCFGNIEIAAGSSESNNAMLSSSNKAWNNVIRGFGASDYVSLSEDDAKAPRAIDGSMPTRFARLKSTSILIDKGKNMSPPTSYDYPFSDQPIYGIARDLGPYELREGQILSVSQIVINPNAGSQISLSPNPAYQQTVIKFSCATAGIANISLYNTQGQLITTIYSEKSEPGIEYYIPFMLNSLSAGVYVCRISVGSENSISKLLVVQH
jgi:hypothetical protein